MLFSRATGRNGFGRKAPSESNSARIDSQVDPDMYNTQMVGYISLNTRPSSMPLIPGNSKSVNRTSIAPPYFEATTSASKPLSPSSTLNPLPAKQSRQNMRN